MVTSEGALTTVTMPQKRELSHDSCRILIFRTGLASSRHNSHYFSNQDLFGLSASQHFRYSKYSELVTEPARRTPNLRVHNVSFALDSRTFLDRACLRLANKSSILQEVSFELFSGDVMALLYTNGESLMVSIGIF